MARYIDLDKINPWLCPRSISQCREWLFGLPVEDVKPVVHAHWVRMYNNDWLCSNCDNILDESTDLNDIRYCSWCGAKMDEGEDNE